MLTLPEFSVSASQASDSYSAGDTVSSSRMNAAIKDLPYSVTSVTSAFLKDFQIFDLNDDLSYVSPSISGNTDSLAYVIRGYSTGQIAIVNGHYRYAPLVAAFVDRIEVIAGPADSLYGQGSPGGGILETTRQPTATAQGSVNVTMATRYNFVASSVHSSGPIPLLFKSAPKLFYTIDAEYQHRTYDVHDVRRLEKATMGAVTYKPSENTNITIEGTWQKYYNPNAVDLALPLEGHFANNPYTGKTGQLYYDGLAWPLRYQYYGSSVDYVGRESSEGSITLQHRFTDWLSLEAGYSRYTSPTETYNTLGSSGVYFPSAGLVASGSALAGTNSVNPLATASPAWSTIMGTSYSYNVDLLAHYAIGKHIDNQTLVTVDDFLNNRKNYTETPVAGAYTPYVWAFSPFSPVTSPYVPRDSNHFTTTTSLNNAVNSCGVGINDRMSFFDNRAIVTFGFRHDRYTGYQTNPSAADDLVAYPGALPGSGRQSYIHANADGKNLGFTFELTSALSWYVSYYEAWAPFGTSVPLTIKPTGNAFAQQQQLETLSPAPTRADGGETGFKYDLNHQIRFTLSTFVTQQKNVGVTELSDPTNPSSPTVTVTEGDQRASGFEASGEYQRGGFDFRGGFSYVDAKVENQGISVLADGHRPRGAPYDSVVGSATYQIPQVTGLRVLASMRYQGNSPQQSPSTGGITNPADGLNEQNNGEINLRAPAYSVYNLGVSYTWKGARTYLANNLNLTVRNLLNKQYIVSGNGSAVGDGRTLYCTYSLAY